MKTQFNFVRPVGKKAMVRYPTKGTNIESSLQVYTQ